MGNRFKAAICAVLFLAGLAVCATSLALLDSRPGVLGTPITIALLGYVGYTMKPSAKKVSFMYGNVDKSQTRQAIKVSLALALICLYGWQVRCLYSKSTIKTTNADFMTQITHWHQGDVSAMTTVGVTLSLLATLTWTLLFAFFEENTTDRYKTCMVLFLVVSAISMVTAAYNGGDPVDWLLCKRQAYHVPMYTRHRH